MKIAMIASNRKPIPSSRDNIYAPGSIIKGLVDNLTIVGHKVTFFGPKDSSIVADRVISENLNSVYTDYKYLRHSDVFTYLTNELQYEEVLLSKAFEMINNEGDFDIVHVHKYDKEIYYSNFINIPMLITGHGMYSEAILTAADKIRYGKYKKSCYYVYVSDYHKVGVDDLNFVAKIPWGIDPNAFPFNNNEGKDLLFLGRIVKRKRPDFAIEVAEMAGEKLIVAGEGGIEKNHLEYWNAVQHLLTKPHVNFVHHVPYDETYKYLGSAKALILPLEVGEPMPITALEAMACGTPIIASKISPMDEIVADGINGFLVDWDDKIAWVNAIKNVSKISRRKCRDIFESKFTWQIMAKNYEAAYLKTCNLWKERKNG